MRFEIPIKKHSAYTTKSETVQQNSETKFMYLRILNVAYTI